MEYITKKIPANIDQIIKYIQAHHQLQKGRRVTEAEVIAVAVEHYAEEKYNYEKKKIKKGLGLDKYAGIIKGGKRSSWKEIDEVVYGG